jgi:RNA polymerase sigma factor (sigma-70 family)
MSPWLSDLLLGSQTDERLVGLARSGQSRAFTAIVERYRRELLALAHRLSPDRAEDLVQQTFLSAFSALQRDADVRHLRGWLYQILRNLAARESGSWTVNDEIGEGDVIAESAEQAAERRMLAMDALGAVAALPATQHVALVQTAIQGRSRTEVADVLGLSEGAVRQLVHRARSTLRAAVTAVTPLPLVRWFANRSSGIVGFSDATIGAGTASTAGLTLKLGIGAVLATGVVASGVITVVSGHPPTRTHASRFVASDTAGAALSRAAHPRRGSSLVVGRSRQAISAGGGNSQHPTAGRPLGTSHDPGGVTGGAGKASGGGSLGSVGQDGSMGGPGSGSGDSSGSGDGSGGSDGHGTSGGGSSDGGATNGSGGSDGGGTSGSGGSDGGGTSGGSGSDGGGTQLTVDGGTDGGSGGTDGGSSGSTTSSGTDGGGGSTSGGDGSGSGGRDGVTTTTTTGSSGD